MQTTKFLDHDCVPLENATLRLLVTQSVGPRILSLRFHGGENLFAELPDFVTERPDGKLYHFYGGHRLWCAPESMPRTYVPDDGPVEILPGSNCLTVRQPAEAETGVEKSMQISLMHDRPQLIVQHRLINRHQEPMICAPWAITQLRAGGIAILPQSQEGTGMLPNRTLVLWPYTDIANPQVAWSNRSILVRTEMHTPFKVGFPNPRGWLAYWLGGTLFVKRAAYEAGSAYYDSGSSSECYCNGRFLELETLGPVTRLEPGGLVSHTETWELYGDIEFPGNEDAVQEMVEKLGLG